MSLRSASAPRRSPPRRPASSPRCCSPAAARASGPQTYQEKAVADATNDAVGTIAVRNLAVEGPPTGIVLQEGSDAPMTVTLVNEGGEDDVLVPRHHRRRPRRSRRARADGGAAPCRG